MSIPPKYAASIGKYKYLSNQPYMACLYDRSESPLLKPTTDAKPARPKSTLRAHSLFPSPLRREARSVQPKDETPSRAIPKTFTTTGGLIYTL